METEKSLLLLQQEGEGTRQGEGCWSVSILPILQGKGKGQGSKSGRGKNQMGRGTAGVMEGQREGQVDGEWEEIGRIGGWEGEEGAGWE